MALAVAFGAAARSEPAMSSDGCELGAYRSSEGDIVAISTLTAGRTRYTLVDGRRGKLGDSDAIITCEGSRLQSRGRDGERWTKVALRLTPTQFISKGVTLKGLLIESAEAAAGGKPPLVVFAHGSENFGWLPGAQATPFLVAAQGVSAFIFDKHGTGSSGGTFHMNFRDLADDLVAASTEAKRVAAGRYGRLGLHGGSQGGWTAPLAVDRSGADFMIVSYGGVFSPAEEDSEQVLLELRAAGFGDDVLAKAREVTKATGKVVASEYRSGFEELARVKAAYGREPWFDRIVGEYSGGVLGATESELRARSNGSRIDWEHDSVTVLRENLHVPTLWVLAEQDRESPGRLTEDRLELLIREGKPISVALFPDTDHGMVEFTTAPDGTRRSTRVTDGYYRLLADWIRGEVKPPYGRARFWGRPVHSSSTASAN